MGARRGIRVNAGRLYRLGPRLEFERSRAVVVEGAVGEPMEVCRLAIGAGEGALDGTDGKVGAGREGTLGEAGLDTRFVTS